MGSSEASQAIKKIAAGFEADNASIITGVELDEGSWSPGQVVVNKSKIENKGFVDHRVIALDLMSIHNFYNVQVKAYFFLVLVHWLLAK